MKWFFSLEKFKQCLEDFNDYPWIKEAVLKVWSAYDGKQVCFPYYTYGRVGYFREEMRDRERAYAASVLKDWCKEI